MQGYLVKLGNDQLGVGDALVGPKIGFNDVASATGSWVWSGVDEDGNTQTNLTEAGTFFLGSDGNVYFVPDTTFPETITSATIVTTPGFDDREFGTAGDDTSVIAAGDDDVVYGGADTSTTGTGNDTINASAGNDTIFGGDGDDLLIGSGGDDSIEGDVGNDVIYGDNETAPVAQSESLNWSGQGANGTDLSGGFTQDTGTMNVTVNFNADGAGSGDKQVATQTQYTETGEPFANDSALFLQGDGGPNTTVSLVFNAEEGNGMTDEVSNISFRLNDVDIQSIQWIDVVTVNAYDIDGNPVTVTLTAEGDDIVDSQTVTGTGSGVDNPDLANGSVLVEIAGPVHSIEIIYSNSVASGNQFLWVTDVHFDTVVDPDGADSISGGDGDDLIYGGADDDIVDGNNDQDTIFGGAGNDTLSGGANNDTVYGGTGNDVVEGDGGADSLFGDEDDDTITGGGGNDELFGGADNDTLAGGNNNDTLFGGSGDDSITGGNGVDTAFGGAGNDDVSLGDGDDVFGNFIDEAGNDTVAGGAGNDTLNAGAGNDTVFGGADNDTITGASGDDTLFGGTGDDQFSITDDHDQDRIVGGEDVGDGDIDTVVFSNFASTQGVTVDYTGEEAGDYDYDGTGGTGSFTQIERLETTDFDDTIDGSGSPTGITVATNDGDDSIIGGAGADDIDAGEGADTIEGGAGDDSIDLGGPDGDPDLLVFSDGDGSDTVANFDAPIDNGDGTFTGIDMLDVSDLNGPDGVPVNTNDVVVSGPAGGPAVLTFPGGETITLTGVTPAELESPFALNAIGIPLPDGTVSGGAGDDLIDGAYLGDPDGDIVDNDDAILPGDAANDDLIEGNGGNDSILAGDGNDEVYGGTGNDTMDGGVGDDTLFGDAGDDTIVVTPDYDTDTIIGGETGETSGDTLDATGLSEDQTLVFSGDEAGTLAQPGSDDTATFSEIEQVNLGSGEDTIETGTHAGTVNAGEGSDTFLIDDNFGAASLDGGEGGATTNDHIVGAGLTDDVNVTFSADEDGTITDGTTTLSFENIEEITTGSGEDTVTGSAGNEVINTSAGNDTINTLGGDDTITTGAGDDQIVITDGFGTNDVTAGEAGETDGDRLDGAALTGDAIVNFSGPEAGQLGVGSDTVDFTEVEVVATGSGDDVINSGTGDDTVETNEGDDSFVVTSGFGNDSYTAGEGGETDGDDVDATALATDSIVTFSGPEAGTLTNDGDTLSFEEVELVQTGAGDDTILSGSGNDSVQTNGGDDTFVVANGFGDDSFVAGETGETDGDDIDATAITTDTTVDFSGPEAGTLTTDGNTLTFEEVEQIATGSGDDTVIGGAGDDNVTTGAGNDTVSGGEGSDTFDTGAGDDTITFAQGDSISSGTGDDTFTLEDLGEPGTGPITIDGGDEDSATGDTLRLGDLADLSTLNAVDDGTGSFSGSVQLDDGSLLTFTDIETIICFTPGTLIATPQGERDIATLKVGDSVVTRDHGLQPIRWIQSRTVPAEDKFAPIRIRPGVMTGQETDLLVSPQHRMLFQGYRAELLFGETEVLVSAKHLLDGQLVTTEAGGMVTYIHMMFDQHEVVYANGAASESFHPGSVGLTAVTQEAREELFTLFPELRSDPNHYGRTARRCLKKHETTLLKP